jgi:crotonobetainyl-CoA:carnitine CoA-transferase CaiB-like acyl-CoA transferase
MKDWVKILKEADVPFAPVKSPEEVEQDPHVLFRKMVQEVSLPSGEKIRQVGSPLKFAGIPASLRTAPPKLGEHNHEVLRALGYVDEEIENLRQTKVI